MTAAQPFAFAIDAQISPTVPGGTETALLALLHALRNHPGGERIVVLGLKGHSEALRPFLGPQMELVEYPKHYRWYVPGEADRRRLGPFWQKAERLVGPLGGTVRYLHGRYAHGQPLSPRARALQRVMGPFGLAAAVGYRIYHGLRYGPPEALSVAQNEAFLRPLAVAGVHFPYPLHFETRLPFVYEPWGLPHRHMPEAFRPGEPEWVDALMRKGCERAAMIVTATRWVKRDIVGAFGVPPSKIAVIPRLPPPPERVDTGDPADALGDVPERFALFPAMTWPTKNHVGLVRALAQLRDETGHRLHLVCTGRTDTPHYEVIRAEIARLGLGEQVRFLGRVSSIRLDKLFRKALFAVHPSKFEGLGLPVVEAFQRGAPVLASTAACIPEVVGDAALTFDPDDVGAIAAALRRAIEEPELLADLRRRGSARLATSFPSPERLARMFTTVYRKAAGAPLDADGEKLLAEMTA